MIMCTVTQISFNRGLIKVHIEFRIRASRLPEFGSHPIKIQMDCGRLPSGLLRAHAIRLKPGDDLVPALQLAASRAVEAVEQEEEEGSSSSSTSSSIELDNNTNHDSNKKKKNDNNTAVFVLTAVGSLSSLKLRLANATEFRRWDESLEIVSLVGTFCPCSNTKHLHMSVSNAKGETFGGHLVSGTVLTTLELVLGTIDSVSFDREKDDQTGYLELTVSPKHKKQKTKHNNIDKK